MTISPRDLHLPTPSFPSRRSSDLKAIERRADQRFEDHIDVTPRQRQVLELIGRGKSTKEIASLMGISVKTVETHRARLMQSLGLYGTNALMRHAIRVGLDHAMT